MITGLAAKLRERPVHWAVFSTMILAILLVSGTYMALQAARLQDAKAKAHETALGWAEHLMLHSPELEQLFLTGALSESQIEALAITEGFGLVSGFTLFASDGDVLLALGDIPDFLPLETRRSAARRAALNDHAETTFLVPEDHTDEDRTDTISRVPIRDSQDAIIGAAELRIKFANPAMTLSNFTGLVLLGVPMICAFAFLLPMLVMIRNSRRAKLREDELASLARQDGLTGLLNRNGIAQRIRPIFAERRDPAEQIGVLLVDLDNFKSVNDIFSPAIADAYLCQTSERLLGVIGTAGFVGRMNGDEFIIILPTITREALRRYGKEVQGAVAAPLIVDGQTVLCTASIGLHLSPVGQQIDRALHAADLALNQAIANGYGQIVEYIDALDQRTNRHNQIESQLRRVGFDRSIEVRFQPFVDAKTGLIKGFEALARMRSETGEIIGPDEFIPVAETTGMIHELGMVVLRKAMKAARKWPAPIFVSVNLSPVQFQNPNLAQDIIALMDRTRLPPERLELELTESLLVGDEEGVSLALHRLQNAGISIAMDDFGTGYSSLGYLWKYRFNKIKIDKSFLHGHDFEESRYFDIIATIILLGHKLGMSVTVEGVETRRQVEVLTHMSCDQFQGYYFARPLTLDQANAVVDELCAPLQKSA